MSHIEENHKEHSDCNQSCHCNHEHNHNTDHCCHASARCHDSVSCHEHSHEHDSCGCHEHSHEHDFCGCHEHSHEHDSCGCHEHSHEHSSCGCHEHSHNAHEEHCCEHCEAKLHGDNTVSRLLITRIIVSAVLFAAGFFLPFEKLAGTGPLGSFLPLAYYLWTYLIIGYDVLLDAAKNIRKGQIFDEQFLMAIATIGAFAIGDYAEGVAVMLFYQVGEMFQTMAVGKSRRSIASLMDIRPDYAIVLRDGAELRVTPEDVIPGELILVKPGEKIPLDGIVVSGSGSINASALTGESLPQTVTTDSRVLSGTINLDGLLTIRTESNYAESTVSKILELVEHASSKKTKVESFITRFSRYYTPIVVLGALLLAILPPLLLQEPFADWLHRGLVFLVVSCPCALVVSVPLSFFGGIGGASRKGILIKGSNYLELLSKVDTIVFDKTGTLTKGSFSVSKIVSETLPEEELLQLAAAAESHSTHPIARCIATAVTTEPDHAFVATEVTELAGKGIRATINDKTYSLGNAALMAELGITPPHTEDCGTVIFIAEGNTYLGYLLIADELKPDTVTALTALKQNGIQKTVMLTGDNKKIAEAIAATLPIDEIHAELLPQDKVGMVEQLLNTRGKHTSGKLAFVGDGINDAPVLARADVGIAMGGIGSDAAIESADIVLMDDKLTKLPTAITIAKKTMRIVRQNIWFALLAKAVILVFGALGIANMWIAVFGDVGVMLLAVLNAMRAMFCRDK